MRRIGARLACVAIGLMLSVCGCGAESNCPSASGQRGLSVHTTDLLQRQQEGTLRCMERMHGTLKELSNEAVPPTQLTGALHDLAGEMEADVRRGKRSAAQWWHESLCPPAVRARLRESGKRIRATLAELPG